VEPVAGPELGDLHPNLLEVVAQVADFVEQVTNHVERSRIAEGFGGER
jgi:hypothetical protein